MRKTSQMIYVKWTSIGPIRLRENGYVWFGNPAWPLLPNLTESWDQRGVWIHLPVFVWVWECSDTHTHAHTHLSKSKGNEAGTWTHWPGLLFPSLGFLIHPPPLLSLSLSTHPWRHLGLAHYGKWAVRINLLTCIMQNLAIWICLSWLNTWSRQHFYQF